MKIPGTGCQLHVERDTLGWNIGIEWLLGLLYISLWKIVLIIETPGAGMPRQKGRE